MIIALGNMEIPITEEDIEMFKEMVYQDSGQFTWTFPVDMYDGNKGTINVTFKKGEDDE